ncbi:MAG: alkaline phosphatase family protein [Candidatus Hodarchaeota archaeon]
MSNNKNSKIFLIGLDGATWDLIKPWTEDGKLPTFKKLMNEGAWGILESTMPPLSPIAWTSIFTGVTPRKHSIYGFVKRTKTSYVIRPISSRDISSKLLWEFLSEAGIRGVFLNIPFMYPPSALNGILTTGLGTPSRGSNFSYPREVKSEILDRFPNYEVDFNEEEILTGLFKQDFILGRIKSITKAQIDAFKYLYTKERSHSQIFAIVLRSLDIVQHYFCDNRDTLLQFYQQADDFLNWCLRNKNAKDTLIICSDHGFQQIKYKVRINEWLRREGFLSKKQISALKSTVSSLVDTTLKIIIKLRLKRFIWKIKHSKQLELLNKLFPSKRLSYVDIIDWERTYAFFDFGLTIAVNLRGREPEGCVPQTKYDQVRNKIIKKANELEHPKTGEKVLEYVYKGEEIYGKATGVPDLILYFKEGYGHPIGFSKSGEIFEEPERIGDHALNGIICFYGNMVNNTKLQKMKVWDVAPMILQMFGVPIPNYFDGEVRKEVFRDDSK